jgi:polysaccharide biosynthesis protein PslH
MNLLFISAKDVEKKSNGGELCTNRNYLSFCRLIGKENVTVINLMEKLEGGISNSISKRYNYIFGFYEGLSHSKIKDIIKLSKDHEFVFIDSSIHGTIAYHLNKSGYKGKIISFFHNVEYRIKLQKAKIEPWRLAEIFVTYYSENMACRYSDNLITVNQRDKNELEKVYEPKNVSIIPISLLDRYVEKEKKLTSVPPKILFTGNNWYANIHGLTWFIDNVLDHVEMSLQITGLNMESVKDKFNHPKIKFLGFVDDLTSLLNEADYVLLPIFIGSGMKVKTCEALMFGKNIIGTSESFEGYSIVPDEVGALCNTQDEFIEAINRICSVERDKFNGKSRNYFLQLYSFEATLGRFNEMLS